MSARPDGPPSAAARERLLEGLAATLGVGLPPFDGPLVAFRPGGPHAGEDPVYLGGDLHAVHPSGDAPRPDRDPSLDSATLTFIDQEHATFEVAAVGGVWCTRIEGERLLAAPYLLLTDFAGRRRAWLILPPPRLMVDIAHFWLPSIPPPPGPPTHS